MKKVLFFLMAALSAYSKPIEEYGYQVLSFFEEGGSTADTFLALDLEGKKVVVKSASWEGIGGNGVPWLLAQYEQLQKFNRQLPESVSSYFPKVYKKEGDQKFFSIHLNISRIRALGLIFLKIRALLKVGPV